MLENQFINIGSPYFTNTQAPVPIPLSVCEASSLPYPLYIYIPGGTIEIALLNSEGDVIKKQTLTAMLTDYRLSDLNGLFRLSKSVIKEGRKYIPRINIGTTESPSYRYGNPLVFIAENGLFAYLKYRCNEDAFGFPFGQGGYATIFIPIRLHSPQNVQEDKTYVKTNGEVVTLYAKYYREWDGETEFLSAEIHDKIVAALSCDEVYIDGKRVTKSDNYQVDWENYDLDCDGVTKIARATFKVRENTNQRNSNF